MAIAHVHHIDSFHIIYKHYKRIGQLCANLKGKRTDLFASALRVLELMREEQIKRLLASGIAEENIFDEMLGFAMTWEQFQERSGKCYSKRSFETITEAVLESGAARRCYVECHRHKEDGREELVLVRDETGQVVTYATIEEARENRRSGGDIINFFHFNAELVNDLTSAIYHLAKPTPPTGGQGTKNGGAQQVRSSVNDHHMEQPPTQEESSARVGNNQTVSSSEETIAQPSQFCEPLPSQKTRRYHGADTPSQPAMSAEGSQNCEGNPRKTAKEGSQNCEGNPRKTASNKNNKKREEITEESNILISAPRAIDPLLFAQFDFSQTVTPEVILQLSRMIYAPLPDRYKTDLDKEAAQAKETAAAQAIAEWPKTHELGLRYLAATMAYHADESSACRFRAYCRAGDPKQGRPANPGLPMRLHQLKSEMILYKMSQERADAGWWPDYLPERAGLIESPPVIDLAELAGIDQAERVGMDVSTIQIVEDWLKPQLEPYGYQIIPRRVGPTRARGYCIEVRYPQEDGSQRGIRFYRFDDWDLIIEADGIAPIGTPEFVRHLSEAVRRPQVA